MRELLVVCAFLTGSSVYAAGSGSSNNFQLTTPPIPNPTFEKGVMDAKLTGTFLHLSEDSFSLNGAGFDYTARWVPTDRFAFGVGTPLYLFGGSLSGAATGTMTLLNWSPGVNVQALAINTPRLSAIVFGGFNINFFTGAMSLNVAGINTAVTLSMLTSSIPLGLQLGVPVGTQVVLAPFYSFTPNLGGTVVTSAAGTSTSTSIPSYTSQSFGADIIFPKYNMSVGSLLQMTQPSQSSETTSHLFMLSATWHMHKGPDSAAPAKAGANKATTPATAPEATTPPEETEETTTNISLPGKKLPGF